PSHGTLSAFNPATGVFTYTPAANYNGSDSFTFKASDGSLDSNTATFTLSVAPVNDNPTASNDNFIVGEDTGASSLNVLANDLSTPDAGETLTITSVAQGQHGTVTIVPGGLSLTYTPNADYAGADTFLYSISDGNGGTAFAAVVVDVTNDAADRLE